MRPPSFVTVALVLTLTMFATVGASCGSTPTKSLLVSEAVLSGIGTQFVNAATEISKRCNATDAAGARTFAPPTTQKFCADFRDFEVRKFKPGFANATSLWRIARDTRDAAMGDHSMAIINALLTEAMAFLSQLHLTIGTSAAPAPVTVPTSAIWLSGMLPLLGLRGLGDWSFRRRRYPESLLLPRVRAIQGGSAVAGAIPLLLQIIPLVMQYGPEAVAAIKRLIDAIMASPMTTDQEQGALAAAWADLQAVADKVQSAPEPEP